MSEGASRVRRQFPPRPSSVRDARLLIRECLEDAGREDLVETAELMVSEIVTNALVHAGTAIEVSFSFVGGGLRVEVTDGSPHRPARRGYGPNAGTGRGIMLLEELVDEWGVVPDSPGKTVWFHIATRSEPGREEPAVSERPRAEGEVLNVELLDVPLLLHEAWRQHAESLLREYLLASLDLNTTEDPIAVHARASDAISLLAEHIPESGLADDPDEFLTPATEPLVTCARVVVPVPVRSVPNFEALQRALLAALDLVEGGVLMTAPTQPEVQGLRTWLCDQVLSQSRGAPAVAWSAAGEPPPRYAHTLAWDTSPVRLARTGVVAADDEARIVAVSDAALELLGYDDAGDLMGIRLTAIIPPRFRQAHLAGFTMFFLSGRDLIVDRPVVVPVLRRDGSEVEVRLTVHTDRTDEGRTVFVADLERVAA